MESANMLVLREQNHVSAYLGVGVGLGFPALKNEWSAQDTKQGSWALVPCLACII